MKHNLLKCSLFFVLWLVTYTSMAQTIISGKIANDKGESLVGASVAIVGTTIGTITDANGNYKIQSEKVPPFKISVSYVGYITRTLNVNNASSVLNIRLTENLALMEEVVVSASRRAEKVQDAPASVSVITAKTLGAASSAIDPIRELVNVPGVQLQQQSASRINIEMRGSAGIFGTSTFPIMDYRSLVGPGLSTFQSDASGLSTLDLQRIEVVRGPGSALYGPGVTSGVVHFITKSPIDYPGQAIELIGGEKNTYGVTARFAQASKSKKFGFKINAQYRKGDEFTLDGSEGTTDVSGKFTSQISKFKKSITTPVIANDIIAADQTGAKVLLNQAQLDPDGDGNMMQNFWENHSINTTLEFRPQANLKIVASGGINNSSSVFYNDLGEGLSRNNEYWLQARVQKGGLFAQMFYIDNDGGTMEKPTFLYQSGNTSIIGRKQLEGQLQYNFEVKKLLNANFTVGLDYRKAILSTGNTVHGRNENNDDYGIIGSYAQGKFQLSNKFDLVLAGRADKFNYKTDPVFSPRAALVYKATPNHTFRASYNQAVAPVTALGLYIDFPVNVPAPKFFDVWVRGVNTPQKFSANPMIDLTVPGFPDIPYGTPGLPLAIPYGALTPSILPALQAALPANLFPIVQAILTNPANAPKGTTGKFSSYNIFTGKPLTPVNLEPSTERYEKSFELGYKGTIDKKWNFTVDWYHISTKGLTNNTAISPTIGFTEQNIANDLSKHITTTLIPQLEAILKGSGLNAAVATATANQVGAAVAGAYAQGGTAFANQIAPLSAIFGSVETDVAPVDGLVHNMAGYRTFGKIAYWGTDIGLSYAVNNDLSVFGNLSALSTNYFNAEDLGEAVDSGLEFSLNIPKVRYRLGVAYAPTWAWRGNIAFQHDDSFKTIAGQYSGTSVAKNLIDAGVGYKMKNGLAIDLTCTNLFNQQYRAFTNMPIIGRRAIAKLTYNFGGGKAK
jgi:outer membrane receptor for ferrienterochelin and colicins